MNYWLKIIVSKKKRSCVRFVQGRKACQLINVSTTNRETLKQLEMSLSVDDQDTGELDKFYRILTSIFLDLSSFREPVEATLVITPISNEDARYVVDGAIAVGIKYPDLRSNDPLIKIVLSYKNRS